MFPNAWLAGHYVGRVAMTCSTAGQDTFTVFDGHCAFVGSCILQQAPAAELHVRHVLTARRRFGLGRRRRDRRNRADRSGCGEPVLRGVLTDDNTRADGLGSRGEAVQSPRPSSWQRPGTTETSTSFRLSWCTRASDRTRRRIRPRSRTSSASAHSTRTGNLRRSPRIRRRGFRIAGTRRRAHRSVRAGHGHRRTHGQEPARYLDSKLVSFPGTAIWAGCSFAAGIVSGAIAARTVPGRRSARQALEALLAPRSGPTG